MTTSDASIKCRWCGKQHLPSDGRCPDVKSMEFHPDGTVKRVEFFAPNDYPQMGPIWLPGSLPNFFGGRMD